MRGLDSTANEPIAIDDIGNVVDRDQLERAFRGLSVEQRTVIVLRHYLGLPVGQVAEAVDAPVETVRSRLRYALRTMRAAIDSDSRPPTGGAPSVALAARADTARGSR